MTLKHFLNSGDCTQVTHLEQWPIQSHEFVCPESDLTTHSCEVRTQKIDGNAKRGHTGASSSSKFWSGSEGHQDINHGT